jgi:integrase/recombinase XerD
MSSSEHRPKRKAPPGCYWRGNVLWGKFQTQGQEYRFSLETDNEKDARVCFEAEKARIIKAHRFGVTTDQSFAETVQAWGKDCESAIISGTLNQKTYDRYCASVGGMRELEGVMLNDITLQLILRIVERRKTDGVSHATIKRDLNALSSVLTFAVGTMRCANNAVREFFEFNKNNKSKIVREKAASIRLPRPQDIEFAKANIEPVFGWLIDAAIKTGARQDELAKLKHDDIDGERRAITITGKRGKTRSIDGRTMAAQDLFASMPRHVRSPFVFWKGDGKPVEFLNRKWSKRMEKLTRLARKQGVDFQRFTFHSMRHLHAIEFLRQRGGSLHALQYRLGHETITLTERYIKSGLLTQEERDWAIYGRPVAVPTAPAAPALAVVG